MVGVFWELVSLPLIRSSTLLLMGQHVNQVLRGRRSVWECKVQIGEMGGFEEEAVYGGHRLSTEAKEGKQTTDRHQRCCK